MGLISTQLATSTTLAAGAQIPVGEIIHKNCTKLNASGTTWSIKGTGYYKVTAFVTVAPTTAGDITLTMSENGGEVASGFATTEANGDAVTIPIQYVGLNECPCMQSRIVITTSVAATVSESDVIVERSAS